MYAVCVGVYTTMHLQRSTMWSWFFPLTFTWVPGPNPGHQACMQAPLLMRSLGAPQHSRCTYKWNGVLCYPPTANSEPSQLGLIYFFSVVGGLGTAWKQMPRSLCAMGNTEQTFTAAVPVC